MTDYNAPLTDIRFLLNEVAGLPEIARLPGYEDLEAEDDFMLLYGGTSGGDDDWGGFFGGSDDDDDDDVHTSWWG